MAMMIKLKRGMARRPPTSLARAISAAAAMQAPDGGVPVPPAAPQSLPGPSQAAPVPDTSGLPPVGATDGLGAGTGGLAVHPSLKSAKIAGYEPPHSSKHR